MYCPKCGNLVGDAANYCPNCGSYVGSPEYGQSDDVQCAQQRRYAEPPIYSSYAIAGFVAAIISLFINFWGIVGIVALVLSIIGEMECKNKGKKGSVLAVIGIVIGALSVVFGLFALALLV